MKIAVMGAGLSGLSCAIMLERYGLEPEVFESRSRVGDRFINAEGLLPILNRPADDDIAYLSENYGIYLKPLSNIRKISIYSENKKADLQGHLGFINLRGRIKGSFEDQLSGQVKTKINFNSKHSYEELVEKFTHVILATGDAAYAAKIQDFQTDLTVTLKGATVTGNFDKHTVGIWLNNELAPQGYCYLLPYSEKEACITIGYPDYPHNQKQDINILWDRFYQRVSSDWGQKFKITDRFEVTRYMIGICKYPRIGNTFFIGNCFGSIMPSFGFGQFPAVLTGIYAAQDLAGKGDYTELTGVLRDSYDNSLAIRRSLEQLDNRQLDKVVGLLNSETAQKILSNSNYDPLKLLSHILGPLARMKLL